MNNVSELTLKDASEIAQILDVDIIELIRFK